LRAQEEADEDEQGAGVSQTYRLISTPPFAARRVERRAEHRAAPASSSAGRGAKSKLGSSGRTLDIARAAVSAAMAASKAAAAAVAAIDAEAKTEEEEDEEDEEDEECVRRDARVRLLESELARERARRARARERERTREARARASA